MKIFTKISKSTISWILSFMYVLCDAFMRWYNKHYPVLDPDPGRISEDMYER